MSKYTQPIEELINYDALLKKCFPVLTDKSPLRMLNRLFLVLSLTTGLKVKTLQSLKWKDLFVLGSENDAAVKEELIIRKYAIPVHPKVRALISDVYIGLGFPKLHSKIIEADLSFAYKVKRNRKIAEMLIKEFGVHGAIQENYHDYFNKLDSEAYLQTIFGRKVFEVCGYTNKVCKKLKQHFELRSNRELFDFLGYTSAKEIKYELNSINLTSSAGISDRNNASANPDLGIFKLDDKNFNNGYSFQKFSAFSKFLISRSFGSTPAFESIRILLLLSLYNGIRPSTLIRLKWKDILKIDEIEKTVGIVKLCAFEGYNIKVGKEIATRLLYHLDSANERMTGVTESLDFKPKQRILYASLFLSKSIFVTNTDNPLTQPSLSREITKALNDWKFPHTGKFTSKSTLITYGRRIIEVKGDHKPTIQILKQHFNFRSQKELFDFLYIDYKKIKGKRRATIFEEILYDL